ncbi:MAG: hypothetical protein LAO77_21780 [Acidobacteriia bacterium]|nr:hypothetical protein [Terriglobia bacterium]
MPALQTTMDITPGHSSLRKNLWLLVMCAVVVAFSCFRWPLMYDETWNYNETASLGPIYTLTHYNFNNHMLYAFFMSLLPGKLVALDPFLMRIPNWLTACGLFALIYLSFGTALRAWRTNGTVIGTVHLLLATSAVFASAQLAFYYLVGRGYLLGCTLALAAIYVRQRRFPSWISDVCLMLSAYSVITYTYLWPGVLAVDFLEEGVSLDAVKRVLWRWSRSTFLLFLAYASSLTRMRAESQSYQDFGVLLSYTQRLLRTTFDAPSLSALLVIGAMVIGIATYLETRAGLPAPAGAEEPAPLIAAYLSGAIASFFVVSEATNGLHIVQTPYVRNASFVSLFSIMAIGLSGIVWLGRERFKWLARTAALAVFAVIVFNGWTTAGAIAPPLLTGKYLHFPVSNLDCPVPINNAFLKSLPKGAELFCLGYSGSVCWPFQTNITRYGLSYLPGGGDAFDREPRSNQCWSGTEAADRSCTLYVRARKGDAFQPLCY